MSFVDDLKGLKFCHRKKIEVGSRWWKECKKTFNQARWLKPVNLYRIYYIPLFLPYEQIVWTHPPFAVYPIWDSWSTITSEGDGFCPMWFCLTNPNFSVPMITRDDKIQESSTCPFSHSIPWRKVDFDWGLQIVGEPGYERDMPLGLRFKKKMFWGKGRTTCKR